MTEGTSQGLFVVVAIVIFGIFIGLSYTLFGDTLKPALVNLFEQATKDTTNKINKYSNNLFTMDDLTVWTVGSEVRGNIVSKTKNEIILKPTLSKLSAERYFGGLVIDSHFLEANKNYILSFDILLDEGTISMIGGHIHIASKQEVYLDGKLYEVPFTTGVPIPNDEKVHHIDVFFNSNKWDEISDSYNRSIYIQPNRGTYLTDYRVNFSNIEFREVFEG